MFNFFDSKIKYRAFKKALREVENEGLYQNLRVDESSMEALPDMSRAVASLSNRTKPKAIDKEETENVAELLDSLSGQMSKSTESYAKMSRQDSADIERSIDKKTYYEKLFGENSLLNAQSVDEPEFLDGNMPDKSQNSANIVESSESRRKQLEELSERIRKRRAEMEEQISAIERRRQKETVQPEIKPDIELPELKQEKQQTIQPVIKVEVMADKPNEDKTTQKSSEAKKPRKKTTKTNQTKKKRKYDADISGGFDF